MGRVIAANAGIVFERRLALAEKRSERINRTQFVMGHYIVLSA